MGREGLIRHLVLAVIGAALLLIASGPLHWGPIIDFVGWMWAGLLVPAVALGALAGVLDGSLTTSPSRAGTVFAVVLDIAILIPLWWVAVFMLGLSGQVDGESSDPSTVSVPIVGWLIGPLVLHLVATTFRRRARSSGPESSGSAVTADQSPHASAADADD